MRFLPACFTGLLISALGAACLPVRAAAAELPALTPAESVQNAVSTRLAEMTAAWCEKQRPRMDGLLADLQRTLHLPPERLNLLRLAAEGVLQKTLDARARSLAREAEARTSNAEPRVVAKILAGLNGSSIASFRPEGNALWREALKQWLTVEERQQWEALLADREAYRARAIGEYILSRIRNKVALSQPQYDKLLPLMQEAVVDYLPDFRVWWGEGEERSFYTENVLVFARGLPEAEVQAILTPAQQDKWQAAAGDAGSMWDSIRRAHEQRIKRGAGGVE